MLRHLTAIPPYQQPQSMAVNHAVLPTHPVAPVLYTDLWGVIGGFASRADLLNLRTASLHLNRSVDRSIRGLTVAADAAPAMLAVLRNATNLNHIDSICVKQCNNQNFPALVDALATLPLAKIKLELVRESPLFMLLAVEVLRLLRNISPASLHLVSDGGLLSNDEIDVLGQLGYPVSITAGSNLALDDDLDLSRLAGIGQLAFLSLRVRAFSDSAARAFQAHASLKELCLRQRGASQPSERGITISDTAVAALAANVALRTLAIGPTLQPMGNKVLEAFAANTTLESLEISVRYTPFNAAAALIISENNTLKHVQIALQGGYHHLNRMRSLESLVIDDPRAEVSLNDARQIVAGTHLKSLAIKNAKIEPGALAVLATIPVETLTLYCLTFDDQTVAALLSNRTLRNLYLILLHPRQATVQQLIAVAGHATLTSLSFAHGNAMYGRPSGVYIMTNVEPAAMYTAWGPHRPAVALTARI